MKSYTKYFPLLLSLMLYVVLWIILQPVLGYILDSDCVAYLTIAERMARGEWMKSVNGLWSPLNSFLLSLCIGKGFDAWQTARGLNLFFGAVVLIQSYFLFLKFNIQKALLICLHIALSIAMVYFVFFQMFGDVLQLIFVLSYLFVLWRKPDHRISVGKAILCGIIMGMGFYAKAYSFFFFGLHFLAILIWRIIQQRLALQRAVMLYFCGLGCAILVMLPWTIALHKKYNEWSLSGMAGKLNMSWYINSGKSFRPDIQLLIPPTYDDSPSFWEDPYQSQEALSSPFSSATHFVKWIFRVGHTFMVCILCFQEISFLGPAILLTGIFYFFFAKKRKEAGHDVHTLQELLLTICILPSGYLMMHIETRYIWLNVILLMVAGAVLLQAVLHHFTGSLTRNILIVMLAISFAVYPLFQFENLKHKNEDLFQTAAFLNEKGIRGKFTSNAMDAGRMWVIAYLTKSNFYTIEKTGYGQEELLREMKRYQLKYYFFETENNVAEPVIPGLRKIWQTGNLQIMERAE